MRSNISIASRLQPGIRVELKNGKVRVITARCGPRVHWMGVASYGRPIHGNAKAGNCWDYDIAKQVRTLTETSQ